MSAFCGLAGGSSAGLRLAGYFFVRVADGLKIAQHFSAGRMRSVRFESVKRPAEGLPLHGSVVRFTDSVVRSVGIQH